MSEDLTKLSKKEIDDRMSELSTQTTQAYPKVANAKTDSERAAAQVAYDALTAEYHRLEEEYNKRVAS